jgi:hypothetical protein
MAAMNGEQVAAEIKRIRPTVPILLWSAYIDLPESAFTQVDAYLLKCEPVETLWLLSRNCCSEQ